MRKPRKAATELLRAARPVEQQGAIHFGAFVKVLRHRQGIRQLQVLAHLPGWTQATYSRVETGELSPAFDQLAAIYTALAQAGVEFTPQDRQQFLTLARLRIESKKTYLDRKSDQEWAELRLQLSQTQREIEDISPQEHLGARIPLVETRHLVGREDWLASVITSLSGASPKKLIVLQGPVGIGKSSELHRIALHFLSIQEQSRLHILLCALPTMDGEAGPESALDLVLGTILADLFPTDTAMQKASLSTRSRFVVEYLEKMAHPLLVLVDNAEYLLNMQGQIASCWEQFLQAFLRSQHRASLVLATREWPGWFEGERVFLTEREIPALSAHDGVLLLQQLGLAALPTSELRRASDIVGGVPLCLEWVASLVQEPMWLDSWENDDELQEEIAASDSDDVLAKRLQRLLNDTSLFGGPIASKLSPLLKRIFHKRLSPEAVQVLQVLALAQIPLAKPALQSFCSRPRLLKELSSVSLLAMYPNRVQLLPMVAAQVRDQLTYEERIPLEKLLMEALSRWLNKGNVKLQEASAVVAELAALYLRHYRLLDAAQLLTCYGWISFNQGYAFRLARLAANVKQQFDWHNTEENTCGGILLHYLLAPYLGESIDVGQRVRDHQYIYERIRAEHITLLPTVDIAVTHDLIKYDLNKAHFEKALALLDTCEQRLQPLGRDQKVSLLEKRAWIYTRWCEYAEEQEEIHVAREKRHQSISLYKQCVALLSSHQERSELETITLKRRLARDYNQLGYLLNKDGQFEEALSFLEQSIALKEQGYVQFGSLAASYGEKAESLMALGYLQESLLFDEKALSEVQRCADMGHASSQQEIWIYRVNRGRLYLRLGRVEEAKELLEGALEHIHPKRRIYRMLAKEALDEIKQWSSQVTTSQHQLDWRWIERYRHLASYDGHWWLAHAGPFTAQEQQLWDQLSAEPLNDQGKERLSRILIQSRDRELTQAVVEQREPHLHYPTIDISDVRRRIAGLLQLDREISQSEPHALVRRLYHGAIEEEKAYLCLIEATYEGNTENFWQYNCQLHPVPTPEEMEVALFHFKQIVQQGLQRTATREASQKVLQLLQRQLQLSLDLSETKPFDPIMLQKNTSSPVDSQRVTSQTAKRFFEAVLQESHCEGWQVKIDTTVNTPRIEHALRYLFLPDLAISLEQIRHFLVHELAGHVVRSVVGEHSPLGLLSIHTQHSLTTEEGLALYRERQAAAVSGETFDAWRTWIGAFSVGLASGVITPPQTFFSLCTFLQAFFLLRRLIEGWDNHIEYAQEKARTTALMRCLRTFRGVPDLEKAGVCYTKDVVYLRGLLQIERAVANDPTVLDRLMIGKIALELLPEMRELGIVVPPPSLAKLAAAPDLETYISDFATADEDKNYA